MEYVRVNEILDHPIGAVWGIVAGFGALKTWVDGVEACSLEGEGVGAIRTVIRGGALTRERLEAVDATQHCLVYLLLPPYRLPAEGVRATIELTALDSARTAFCWWSEATKFNAPQSEVAARIDGFYRASIANLRNVLRSASSS
jgi:hypothetical protein